MFLFFFLASFFSATQAGIVPESILIWETLTTVSPASTKATPKIKVLLNKPIDIAGFTVVNEMDSDEVSEFLLTEYPGSCIHVPPPPPNHMIHVVMQKGKTTPNFYDKRVVVHGVLQMGSRIDSAYEMVADEVKLLPL
jgi:hypothetical protein